MANYIFLFIGFLISIIITYSAWKDNFKETNWKDDPRVKAATYVLLGSIVAFIGDWESIFGDAFKNEQLSKLEIALFYVAGSLAGLLFSLITYSILIVKKYGSNDLLDFLSYGYGYVKDNKFKQLERILELQKSLSKDRDKSKTTITTSIASFIDRGEAGEKKVLSESILERICKILEPYLSDGKNFKINANYMVAVPCDEASDDIKNNIKFAWGDTNRYSHFLTLGEYAEINPRVPNDLVLPVENRSESDWEDMILPGAPASFVLGEAVIFKKPIEFSTKIPRDVQTDIENYFDNQEFTNFLSVIIPVRYKGYPLGIVNIETNQSRIEEYRNPNALVELINPFIALLGLLIKCEKK